MLTLGLTGRIWVAVAPVDARKSFDTLAAVVTAAALGRDPLSGDLFVFANKKRDRLAVLAWQGDGFALLRRRLEKGTFALPAAVGGSVAVTPTQLAMILGGLDPAKAKPRRRYARPNESADSA